MKVAHSGATRVKARLLRRLRAPTVAILGLGPSAAYAYRACLDCGVVASLHGDQAILPRGAFWLHWLPQSVAHKVPGQEYQEGASEIEMMAIGTPEEYVYKQWGPGLTLQTSFPVETRRETGYEPVRGMRLLWGADEPPDANIGKLDQDAIRRIARQNDLVIQTFPTLHRLPGEPMPITFATVYREAPKYHGRNMVIYLGIPGPVVRSSFLWSIEAHELVAGAPVQPWLNRGYKVVHKKDIHPTTKVEVLPTLADNIKYVGRYAEWKRKTLSYEAYGRTYEILNDFMDQEGTR